MKFVHDKIITRKDLHIGQKVLLYNTRLHLFPGKLKSRWKGPYIIKEVHLHGAVDLIDEKDGSSFRVNGHRLKTYLDYFTPEVEELLMEDTVYQD